ncbi:MAG: pilus assembly PilX family protein [Thermoleophilia bacterium]
MRSLIRLMKGQEGAALVVTLGVISIMLIIGVMVTSMSVNSVKTVNHDQQQTMGQNIAEAGVDDAIAVTLANYLSVYPGGTVQTGTGDGVQLFDAPQPLTDNHGTQVGTYQVWTKPDLDQSGNVLITSKGTLAGATAPTETVKVSVKYLSNFDYVLFSGAPNNLATATFTALGRGDHDDCDDHDKHDQDGSCGANITATGKINVNGNMVINALANGDGDHHEHDENPGYVTFLSRMGFTDPVNYTKTLSGEKPSGTQPTWLADPMEFPKVDFSKFTSSVKTVDLPPSGKPTGWTRDDDTFSINVDNFQNRYRDYDVVKFTSSQGNAKIQIIGNCGLPAITSTIMIEGVSGNSTGIAELNLVGPGIDLQPNNGIAILSGGGLVSLQNEVEVGRLNAGALIYLSGQNGTSSLQVNGNLIMYGSVIVNGKVDLTAQGAGRVDHHEHEGEDHRYGSYSCDANYKKHHRDHENDADHYTTNLFLSYDGSYMANAKLPANWWTWTGGSNGSNYTAVKYNYVRG